MLQVREERLEGGHRVRFYAKAIYVLALVLHAAGCACGTEERECGDVTPDYCARVLLDWIRVYEAFEKGISIFSWSGVDGVDYEVGLNGAVNLLRA